MGEMIATEAPPCQRMNCANMMSFCDNSTNTGFGMMMKLGHAANGADRPICAFA